MLPRLYIICLGLLIFVSGCTPTSLTPALSYFATILYQQHSFSGASLSDQSIMVLPLITKAGLDSSSTMAPKNIAKLLSTVRNDVVPVTKEEFEKKYVARHDSTSLTGFYRNLYKGDALVLANSDSVWRQMNTSYCYIFRVKNAITIKGFNNVVKRRMILETELWDVDSIETVLRVEVRASAQDSHITDAEFVKAALSAAFAKIPVFAPANNEKNW